MYKVTHCVYLKLLITLDTVCVRTVIRIYVNGVLEWWILYYDFHWLGNHINETRVKKIKRLFQIYFTHKKHLHNDSDNVYIGMLNGI